MNCKFPFCLATDTIHSVSQQMGAEKHSYSVVITSDNSYVGVVLAHDVLGLSGSAPVSTISVPVPSVLEDSSVSSIPTSSSPVIPVINGSRNVVGVVDINSLASLFTSKNIKIEFPLSGMIKSTPFVAKYTISDIVGQSAATILLKEQILAAAKTKSTVLLLGETGTGKELVAHAIHRLSNRRHNPFIRINCATIPDSLLESELFGYEAGAFTDAAKSGKPGKFELANGGTFFLDEIGDMPFSLQSKLLRVLQEKEIERIGGRSPRPVDVRIITATHQDLHQLIEEGKFRRDLYYRLNVVPIVLQPLRSHRDDIPLLAEFFLGKHSKELSMPKPPVSKEFLATLIEYDWPGNVRELSNCMEFAVNNCDGSLSANDLMRSEMFSSLKRSKVSVERSTLRDAAGDAEKDSIIQALDVYKGNKIKVSEALGISRSSLYNKLKKYGIDL